MLKKGSIVFLTTLLAFGLVASTAAAQPAAATPPVESAAATPATEAAATTETAPPAELIAWYKFDENDAATAFDSSGNGNHAELVDFAMWDTRTDTARGYDFGPSCVAFTDKEDTELNRVTAPTSPSLCVGTNSVSVSFMMKKSGGFEEDHPIDFVVKGTLEERDLPGAQGKRYEVYARAGTLRMALDDAMNKAEAGVDIAPFFNGKWIHVVCVGDRTAKEFHFYIDSVEQPITFVWTGDSDWPTDSIDELTPLVIGNRLPFGEEADNNTFAGFMDDVRIYKGALTPQEIQALYGVPVVPLPTPGPDGTLPPPAAQSAPPAAPTPEPTPRSGPKVILGDSPV